MATPSSAGISTALMTGSETVRPSSRLGDDDLSNPSLSMTTVANKTGTDRNCAFTLAHRNCHVESNTQSCSVHGLEQRQSLCGGWRTPRQAISRQLLTRRHCTRPHCTSLAFGFATKGRGNKGSNQDISRGWTTPDNQGVQCVLCRVDQGRRSPSCISRIYKILYV